ncbi:growth hormone secretagogue receptor type 1-like [Gigantopelta aegis]|uniref:growth hormone secretagogue receptor type 1-like n=1 Tax=Gigantopelta aegis TaxID=1735272 RepID=UPI001B88C1A8|nr:growth hormone secretagogue receptor type 1-like [Gigantopelta aegis]
MNQTSENKTDGVEGVFDVTDIVLTVVDAALIVIIAVGNSLTLVAVCRFKRLRSPTGVAIASLAVADLIMGIVYTPTRFVHITWPSMFASRAACIVYIFVVHFSASCAVIGISMLSTERGYAIQFPTHYQTCMTTRCSVVISLCVFAAIFCLNLPFLSGLDHYNGQDCYAPSVFPKVYLRTLIVVGVAVLLLGFVAFVRVLVAVFRRQKFSNVLSGQQLKQQISSVRCRLMCVVYVSSLVFWLPHLTYYFYNTFTKQTRNVFVFRILSIFDLCSSAVNFFIYGVININFRMAYKQILGLDRQDRRTSTYVSATTVTHFDDVAV